MHLVSIKLAGFKSFVDPTTIDLNPNVSVVVGPNGCGKSNILDAVRWVIGESSAQRLRGEVISDFIFSGSESRPAASRASVELLFDNSDGRVGGDFATYSELSVRREVLSEGQSSYFLNGQRCRRRDIRDVFLGTGFGTRGYSVIQQDWITQLVNSDPETIREHLEEAAGVSKYRARRHETVNKLNLTTQNLEQVRLRQSDLAREIRQLKTQATKARRFEEFSQRLNALKARLVGERLRAKERVRGGINDELAQIELRVAEIDAAMQSHEKAVTAFDRELASQRLEQEGIGESRIEAQTLVNSVVSEIQQAQNQHDVATVAIQAKLEQLRDGLQELESDDETLCDLKYQHAVSSEKLGGLLDRKGAADRELGETSREMDAANAQVSRFTERLGTVRGRIETIQAQLRIDEANVVNLTHLLASVASPDASIEDIEKSVASSQEKSTDGERSREALLAELGSLEESIREKAQRQSEIRAKLQDLADRTQSLRDELLGIETLQEASLGQSELTDELKAWLTEAKFAQASRVGEVLEVEPGWEAAVEVVLGERIQAIVTGELAGKLHSLDDLRTSDVELIDVESNVGGVEPTATAEPLALKLEGASQALTPLFDGVFACETYSEALAMVENLDPRESVVTRDHAWVGKRWVRVFRGDRHGSGVIERQQRAQALNAEIATLDNETDSLQNELAGVALDLESLDQTRESVRERISSVTTQLTEDRTLLSQYTKRLDERRSAVAESEQQRTTRQADINRLNTGIDSAKSELEKLTLDESQIRRDADEASAAANRSELAHETKQQAFNALVDNMRAAEYEQSELSLKVGYLERSQSRQEIVVARLTSDLRSLIEQDRNAQARLPALRKSQGEGEKTLERFERELASISELVRATETKLTNERAALAELASEKDGHSKSLTELKSRLAGVNVELDQLASEFESLSGVANAAKESEAESIELDAEAIAAEIESLSERMRQLGLINYRATTDLEERTAEKQELDAQVVDLEEAMETLHKVIDRIDQETRRSLRATFDAVNQNLAKIFAYLFGGGVARLEFTDDDILQAGVLVRARPPGKRNTTIDMLSGGERAMTAIAFVFALFELSPSPVCILDEVDAPLDERNVVKFAELLAKMSLETQFVVITHNPATMEIAGNLLGITMEEPGVSRLVAVNLEDAFAMAANQ